MINSQSSDLERLRAERTELSDKVKARLARSRAEHVMARERGEAFTDVEKRSAQQDRINWEFEGRTHRTDILEDR